MPTPCGGSIPPTLRSDFLAASSSGRAGRADPKHQPDVVCDAAAALIATRLGFLS